MNVWMLFLIEWIAAAFGVAWVVLTIKRNIWRWPTGLVQVLLYIIIFYHARLYSDVLLHVIYVFMSLYGWWAWLYGGDQGEPLEITMLSPWKTLAWSVAGGVGTASLGLFMKIQLNADLPFLDAATTVLSLIAQFLLARKVLESWVFWIIVDMLGIGIYFYKALYPTAILYSIFLVLALSGFYTWRRQFYRKMVRDHLLEQVGA